MTEPPLRLRIDRAADDEEIAALVAAFEVLDAEDDARAAPAPRPAWLRAARREGVGGGPAAAPADLRSRAR